MVDFAVDEVEGRYVKRAIQTAVTPRPIAWVSTTSEEGVDNLAPFSSYTYAGSNPPVLQVNVSRRDGRLKDTARNAIDTGEFAVNVVTEATIERMDHTSEGVAPDVSEFDLADVDRAPCEVLSVPRVADAPVTMECTLRDTKELHERVLLFGDVEFVHVDDAVTTDGEIDARKLPTVGRLGGPYYTTAEPSEFERQY